LLSIILTVLGAYRKATGFEWFAFRAGERMAFIRALSMQFVAKSE
jgi:hypothetical protein